MVGKDLPTQKLIEGTEVWCDSIETNPAKLPRTATREDRDLTKKSEAVSGDRIPNLTRKGDLSVFSVMPMATSQLMSCQADRVKDQSRSELGESFHSARRTRSG